MAEDIAGGEGCFLRCVLGTQAADCAGFIVDSCLFAVSSGCEIPSLGNLGGEVVGSQSAVFLAAGCANSLCRAGGCAAGVRARVRFCLAAGIFFPVISLVGLPVAKRAAMVVGVIFAVCIAAFRAEGLFVAIGRTAGVDMGRAGFQLQLFIRIVFPVRTVYIGRELPGIVGVTCGGKYAFTGPNTDIRAAGERPKRDGRELAAIIKTIRQIQVFSTRRFRACGHIGIYPCVPGNDRGTRNADRAGTGQVVAFHVDTAAVTALICGDSIVGDRTAVQIQCTFCTHIDTAAVTGGFVLGDGAAIHVHRAV